MTLRALALKQIEQATEQIQQIGYRLKVGFELEFFAFANPDCENAEVFNVAAILKLLQDKFPGKIETFDEEFPLGFTSGDDEACFHFPGVRQYEVTFIPNSPLEICKLAYQVQNFLMTLEDQLKVQLNFKSKPITNEQVAAYVEKAKKAGLTSEVDEETIVYQAPGNSTQINLSLWKDNTNIFFDPYTRDGTDWFYFAAQGLLDLTHESILPFIGKPDAFLRMCADDTYTAAPGAVKLADWKGGEQGKGIVRPSPLPDRIIEELEEPTLESRTHDNFRMETRHNDPSQDQYVCMAAVLSAVYYGLKNCTPTISEVRKYNYPFEKNMSEAIQTFETSKLWPQVIGPALYAEVLHTAKKVLEHKMELIPTERKEMRLSESPRQNKVIDRALKEEKPKSAPHL